MLTDLSMYPYHVLVRDYIHFNVMNDHVSDTVQRIKEYSNAADRGYQTKNIKVIPRVILMYTDHNDPTHEYWPRDLNDGDWTSQAVRDRVVAVVRQLGEAWNDDSRIAWVQMGLIGQWGEQESPVSISQDLGGGVTWAKILEPAIKQAFPNKKVLVRSPEKWGSDFHVGMYWDTFSANGKMNGPNDEWPRIKANNLPPRESYKKAPVEGEVAYNFILSNQLGTNEDATMQNANYRQFFIDTVRSTATTACGIGYNPNNSTTAAGASEVQKVFGYRFLLKKFSYINRVEPGGTLTFTAEVVNAGSAPAYENWPVSVVLIDETTKQIVWTRSAVPSVNITQWLPNTNYKWTFVDRQLGTGTRTYGNPAPTNVINGSVTIPSNLSTKSYLVGLSILDPTTDKPGMFFSVKNFLQASNTQPLARIGVGMNPSTSAISFDSYDWLKDTRSYNLTTGGTLVTVAATDPNAGESGDTGTFTFTRNGSTAQELTVRFSVGGSAIGGSNYNSLGDSVTIAVDQTTASKILTVREDTTVESDETVEVTLTNALGYSVGSPSSATVKIADNDSSTETVPWLNDFNAAAPGATSQGAPNSWTAVRADGIFYVTNNQLWVNGGNTEGVFTSGVMNISGGSVNLSLGVLSAGVDLGDYVKLYTKIDGGPETLRKEVQGAPTETTWTVNSITGNTLQVIIRTKVTALDEFYYLDNLSITPAGLPSPWQTMNIGAVAAPGSASYSGSTWTIEGSGADIWGTADEFRYVHQSANGDCSIVARVASIELTNAWAKAGVMIRESTAANARSAMLCVTPGGGVSFQWRSTTGGSTAYVAVAGKTAPEWLRITRTGNSFTAHHSEDGATWTQVGTAQTITMASNATRGLAVTSHADGTPCTSTMDSVSPQ